MDTYGVQHIWLGTLITLSVASAFAWLSAAAIVYRTVAAGHRRS